MTYTLIIAIYNEERTLSTLLKKLEKLTDNIEIIIIDDGSDDNTHSILNQNEAFITLRNEFNQGKGASIKKGIRLATNQNIILMDGDLEVDIDEIPHLINIFEKNKSDVLVGVRWNKNDNFLFEINTIGNYLINGFFNLLYNSNYNDVLCCIKILDLNLFKSLNIQSEGFSVEIETMAKLVLNGLIIEEIKIKYNRRTLEEGKKLKLFDSWSIVWKMLKLKLLTNSNNSNNY